MELWIAFWTALWVGSSRLCHWTVDWLCAAKRKPAKSPTKASQEPAADDAGEQPTTPPKEPAGKPAAPDAPGSALLRWIGLLLAAAVTKALPWTTVITLALTAAWLTTSLLLGYAAAPRADKPAAEQPKDTQEPPAEEPHPSEILTRDHVALLLADVHTEGSGVHLATLAEHLSRTRLVGLPPTPWATRDVRALLARHGVRIRAGVRVPPAGGREGVHREDFPPLPSPAPDTSVVGVVVPGQSNNNNADNTPSYPFEVIDDPDNPARAHVRYPE